MSAELLTRNVLLKDKDGNALIPYTEKQDTLVSGTNIKTINNQSLLGSGNIEISGGGGGGSYTAGDGIIIDNNEISVDAETTSEVDVEQMSEVDTETTTELTLNELAATITGYDASATQVLKHINGTLTWVTEV